MRLNEAISSGSAASAPSGYAVLLRAMLAIGAAITIGVFAADARAETPASTLTTSCA